MKEKHLLLLGKKIGPLTIKNIVPFYTENRKNQRNYNAEVYCDICKKENIIGLRSVLEGVAKSCGCLRYVKPRGIDNPKCVDLSGKKFSKLKVIKIDTTRTSRVFWVCKCKCGNLKSVASKHLHEGSVKSCGCDRRRKKQNHPCWKGYEEISGKYWWSIQRHAESKHRKIDVDLPYLWKLFLQQNRKCALTGQPLTFPTQSKCSDGNASVDRINSSQGYIKGNVWWVDKDINSCKRDFPLDKFLHMCKMVAEYE